MSASLDLPEAPASAEQARAGAVRRTRTRAGVVSLSLVAAVVVLGLVALGTGSLRMTPLEVVDSIRDLGAGYPRYVVLHERLPRILAAAVFGAALGLAGAVFQSLTRNPLGSPDVIGFSTGSYTGALVVITTIGTSASAVAGGALVGGIGTALLVYALAWQGGVAGFRLIIVGIAVTALLASVNTYLLLRAKLEVAVAAATWGAGSLNLLTWGDVVPALVLIGLLLPVVAALSGPLRQLELGDDAARAHGVRVEPVRLALIVTAVGLTAAVTAVAGPIAFVALSAPQVAHRLCRSAGLPLTASALTGAFLLLLADFAAQHWMPQALPVGVVTVVVGGVYLLWLLAHEARRKAA
ncbi:FecCD family ABC transporter permease [Nocardioides hwasunensis]|uniref:Iron chelate uptake ABC transporter family permease subunit n=1 Tax=Nocardioides hwasunensis TaxID=397258 RepID=A0ABR8MID9_9ACTN|nr:iron chelate uptake ABC transporter family permease subunit [Nocardioides hwasunensis]MBD3915693.1 iron chelate uptake ABC transporter family permease subunit [Nocardioides hwasunensis]